LLGFSGIAHAGCALIGFVALDQFGYTAALYYIIGYVLMVLACFVVICKVSRDGCHWRHAACDLSSRQRYPLIVKLGALHRQTPR